MSTKRAFKVKQKAFFIIFKGLSVGKNYLRPESPPLNLEPWRFGDHKLCRRGNTAFLTYHVTSRDYVRKGSYDLLNVWEPVALSNHSARFLGNRSCGIGDRMFLFCHVASCDHVIKGHMVLWGGGHHPKSPLCQIWWL